MSMIFLRRFASRIGAPGGAALLVLAHAASAQGTAPVQGLAPIVVEGAPAPSPTAPDAGQARAAIERTPGGVEVVSSTAWRATQSANLKDILGYTPGVFVQPKWGDDARLSIRGSGISRYFHLRGVLLYQDGIPLNDADGSADFQQIEPTAYRYTEVYKGANGLRYGASALGGAINFVTPTGEEGDRAGGRVDAGGFGWRRMQAYGGGTAGRLDGFLTGSWQRQDGFRDHSAGDSERLNANLGWNLSAHAQTRFYVSGARIRQEIPGSVTREQALEHPRRANPANLANDYQRNIDAFRLANRTVWNTGDDTYELGGWYGNTHLMHPIYQYLDNRTDSYGAFARWTNTARLAGHDNRFTAGVTWSAGRVDANNYVNDGGSKGRKLSATRDQSDNFLLYAENAYDIVPGLSLIAGGQYSVAERERRDEYNGGLPADRSGSRSYTFFNPKLGVLWHPGADWQVYANVSRSAEPPSFADLNFSTQDDLERLSPQRATTAEIGTRGRRGDVDWDISLYRAWVKDEFQCLGSAFNICTTVNADRTIHQGLEAGLGWTFWQGLFERGDRRDSLRLNAAYTFSDFRFDGDRQWGDNRLPGVPRHYLRAEILYRHPDGWFAGPNVEWVPQAYYVDNANTLRTQPYALLGVRVGWESERYTVFVEGRNLTDRKYIASASVTDRADAGSELFEPGTGRGVYAGVEVRY